MNKVNYQKQLDEALVRIEQAGRVPRLLLHSCCGPCSSYVLEYLSRYFAVTVLFANSNIWPEREYAQRLAEQARLISEMPFANPVTLQPDAYDHAAFLEAVRGLEGEPEGGARCVPCFRQRLTRAAQAARDGDYDFFTTTLSVSPHKDAAMLNEIGQSLAQSYGVPWLPADFKKREGYKRSVALATAHNLYRQDYCGCEFSKASI